MARKKIKCRVCKRPYRLFYKGQLPVAPPKMRHSSAQLILPVICKCCKKKAIAALSVQVIFRKLFKLKIFTYISEKAIISSYSPTYPQF